MSRGAQEAQGMDAATAQRESFRGGRARFRLTPDLLLSFLAGAQLVVGYLLERTGAPTPAWLLPYLGAYLAGGWHATQHAVRSARRGIFDVDLLMITAALGAAALGA